MKKVPHRLAVIMAMQKHLEGITPADGYDFDLRGKVYRNRILLGAEVQTNPPALSIMEAPRADIAVYAGEDNTWRKDHLTLLIQGIVKDDKTSNTADQAYYLEDAVEQRLARLIAIRRETGRALFPDEHFLGGIITSVEIAPPVVRPPEAQVSATAFFYLAVRLGVAGEVGK